MLPFTAKFNDSAYVLVIGVHQEKKGTQFDFPRSRQTAGTADWGLNIPYSSTIVELPLATIFNEVIRAKQAGEPVVDFTPDAIQRLKNQSSGPATYEVR